MKYERVEFDYENLEIGEDYMVVSNTPFKDVTHVYDVKGAKVNTNLAVAVGLGVVMDSKTKDLFLYNPDFKEAEMLRLGIYRQLSNHKHVDVKLDMLMNTKGGREIIKGVVRSNGIIELLEVTFASQKGNNDNIVEFPKKG